MKKLKWSRKKIVGLIAAVLVVAVIVVSAVNAGGTEGRYQETTVAARDIVSYLEFSGNIEAVDVSNVYAGVAAQIMAFACGKSDENRNKNFEGGRPSSIIIGEQLDPKALGALLAHFENKIMFQGFLWNVNSFDQEGVQLGKVLAKKVLAHETDGALKEFSDLLNI